MKDVKLLLFLEKQKLHSQYKASDTSNNNQSLEIKAMN
jgi:hypothetical protein